MLQAFDELVLMKRGGVLIYAGSLGKFSADMISYFEGIPGIFQSLCIPFTFGFRHHAQCQAEAMHHVTLR